LFLGENILRKWGMMDNLVADLSHVTDPAIQKRAIENLAKADDGLGNSCGCGARAGEVDGQGDKSPAAISCSWVLLCLLKR
jgi:hypothetical protein